MKTLIFHLILFMLCNHVLSQEFSTLVPTPTPTVDTSPTEFQCRFVNFTCGPGLALTNRTFSQVEICDPVLTTNVAGRCIFATVGELQVAFICPGLYGLRMSILCIPPDVPSTVDYCFCEGLPEIYISEVPDVTFMGNGSTVTEDNGLATICAIAGQLNQPLTAIFFTSANSAKDGTDYVDLTQEITLQSNEVGCINVTILKDGVDEVIEFFVVNLAIKYSPFDIPVGVYNVTIIDSDIIGVGFEQEVYFTTEASGSVRVCAGPNVTLNGTRNAAAVMQTMDVTAQADVDYLAIDQTLPVFEINGDRRFCVDIVVLLDEVTQDEYHEAFLVQLTGTSVPLAIGQAVVVILDQDLFYPFGEGAGDESLPRGTGSIRGTNSPPLTLNPRFRFFSRAQEEDTLYVNINGVLTFNQPFFDVDPRPFPFTSRTMISPYWEHLSTRRFGAIYYRNTTDLALLRRAQYLLQDVFPSARNFSPSYLVLATWDSVPQLGTSSGANPNQVNTFQVVLATDGEKSFVFYIYFDIQWGLGGIGFNAGDGVRSFTVPGSLTPSARVIEDGSNVGVAGVYAYRVDLLDIIRPGDCRGQTGVIRLFNGSATSEGEVQYCRNSMWTPVCGDTWGENEAAVACRQLGLAGEGATISIQELGDLTPLISELNCTGTESNLSECPLRNDTTSFGSGSGDVAILIPSIPGGQLRPSFNSCQYLARVGCRAVQVGFEQDSYTVLETDESVTVCVNMITGTATVPVTLVTLDIGSAVAGTDYNSTGTEFEFEGAPQQMCVDIDIFDDDLLDPRESFLVILNTTLTNRTVSLNPQYVFVTITDDERAPIPDSSGVIAGSVIAGIVVILCIGGAVLAYLYYRRRKHIMEIKILRVGAFTDLELFGDVRGNPYASQGGMMVRNQYIKHVPKDVMIPRTSLRLLNSIGQGEFGIVYKAHLVESAQAMPTFVAVKTLKGFFDHSRVVEMIKESVRMLDFQHRHVLGIIGVCVDAGPAPYIVMPFMDNGSLLDYIKKEKKSLVVTEGGTDSDEAITARKRLADMCLQIAKGMEYLSSQKIVHRDLAARNCMIDAHFIIKVADFGLSESTYTKTYFRQKKSEAVKLPVKWLAPEALLEGLFSEKSDVWAYGVTCWEIFTGGRIPYPGIDPITLPKLLENGLKLDKPKNTACSEELYFIMFRCWHNDPDERLSFTQLVNLMSQTLESMADYLAVCTFGMQEEATREEEEKNGDDAVRKNDNNDVIIINDDVIEAGDDDATAGKYDNGNDGVGSDDSSDVGREGPSGDRIGNDNYQAAIIEEDSV